MSIYCLCLTFYTEAPLFYKIRTRSLAPETLLSLGTLYFLNLERGPLTAC
jgi:hypothetical protein